MNSKTRLPIVRELVHVNMSLRLRTKFTARVFFSLSLSFPIATTVSESDKISQSVSLYVHVEQAGLYYRKRGSASYIVREVLLVRERDTDRERERRK